MLLAQLTPSALEGLATAIHEHRLAPPWSPSRVGEYVSKTEASMVSGSLKKLTDLEMSPKQIAHALRLVAAERRAVQETHDRVELVWSGPEQLSSGTRETGVVVRHLFQIARRSVLISSYGVDQGEKAEHLFRPLAENMMARPELQVRMYLNVKRPSGNCMSEAALLKMFADDFRGKVWPWSKLPEVYYDPRSLEPPSADRACLHAKCVAVDDELLFITSANFTEAAQLRNLEAGVLISDRNATRELRGQFDGLVNAGLVRWLSLAT